MVQPVVFEGGGVVQFAGVGDAVRIEGGRQGGGQEIAQFFRVDGRLRGAVGVVQVLVRPVIVVIHRSFQAQVRDPGLAEHPREFQVRSQEVVVGLRVFLREGVRVVLAVHAAEVAGHAGLEAQRPGEGAAVFGREAPACVGGIGGGEFLRGAGPLAADVEDALADADALGNGHVVSARIDRESGLHGRPALPGSNLDHTAA